MSLGLKAGMVSLHLLVTSEGSSSLCNYTLVRPIAENFAVKLSDIFPLIFKNDY